MTCPRVSSHFVRRQIATTLLFVGTSGSTIASELPPGFVEELLVEELLSATAMSWAPDNHLWVSGRLGDVWILHLESELTDVEHLGRLPVETEGERGLGGIAVDPDYAQNQHVWLYYTTADPPHRNRLSRFRHVGEQLVDETMMYESPDLENTIHNGGCIRFASDETLFLSTGDDFLGSVSAQSLSDTRGKILHLTRDGSPAPDNPFLGDPAADPRVWAYGLRNPWRFNLQPVSENLFIGDVGNEKFEEINIGVAGGNFGWRLTEGPEPPGVEGVIYPMYYYGRTSPLGHAVIGGDHARAFGFPPEYEGDYFFGDAATNELFRMELDGSNQSVAVELFATKLATSPVDFQFGPDGALYYVSFLRGSVHRIRYVGGSNRQPVAIARVEPDNGDAPLEVTFDATDSYDPEGDPLRYRWSFGDGDEREGRVVQKSYSTGIYAARLEVSDPRGSTGVVSDLQIVAGNHRPLATIVEPVGDSLYDEGQVIRFSGTGVDPEEGTLPCQRFTWSVIFHHLGHTHPFAGPLQGVCDGSFVIDSHGTSETYYEILLKVRDRGEPLGGAASLEGVHSIDILPRQ